MASRLSRLLEDYLTEKATGRPQARRITQTAIEEEIGEEISGQN
jgi:hypothetical protein